MIDVFIEGDTQIVADFSNYSKRVGLATIRALNRAMKSAQTFMVRAVADDTGLKVSDVRKAMPVYDATLQRPVARLSTSLKRIPLIAFNARGPEPSRGKGRGVSYRLGTGGAGRTNAGLRTRSEHAFIATMASGHRGVFARIAKARLPIRELKGPSLGHVFAKYRKPALERGREIFERNFDHEMQFRSTGALDDAGTS